MRRRDIITIGVLLAVFVVLSVATMVVIAATFADTSQSDFDAGTYSSTQWDTNHVELTPAASAGTFTSRVFDSGSAGTTWDQIAWSETLTTSTTLFATDVSAQVWVSANDGTTWTLVNADYNGGDLNGSQGGLVADSNGDLYAFRLDAVWRSTDGGTTWTQRTALYGSGSDVAYETVTSDNTLYIIAGNQGVWRSTDGGAAWTQMNADFNGGGGNVLGLTAVGTTLFAVDNGAQVWTSTNNGTTWTVANADFNGGDGNTETDSMTANPSGHLYILRNGKVWRSTDSGVNWTQQTSNFGSSTGLFITCDGSGNLSIIDGGENVWRSTDSGVNWTQMVANFNGGVGNVGGLAPVAVTTDITFEVRAGDTDPPSGGFSGSHTTPGGSTLSSITGRYFQYQATFASGAAGVTPELSNVTITYTLSGSPTPTPTPTASPTGSPTPTPTPTASPTGSPTSTPTPSTAPSGGTSGTPLDVTFSGIAYPNSDVEILRRTEQDSLFISHSRFHASADGTFSIPLIELPQRSYYLFAIRAWDALGVGSNLLFFDQLVGGSHTFSDIIIPPTVSVQRTGTGGEVIKVSGYAGSEDEVQLELEGKVWHTVTTDSVGHWQHEVEVSTLTFGTHQIRAKRIRANGDSSTYSSSYSFKIGAAEDTRIDLNNDQQVNIQDWSIFLFRWGSTDTTLQSTLDMDENGIVNIIDFSIFLRAMRI